MIRAAIKASHARKRKVFAIKLRKSEMQELLLLDSEVSRAYAAYSRKVRELIWSRAR